MNIKTIAVITPIKREFDIYTRDNQDEQVNFVHVWNEEDIIGIRFNSVIKLYRWFEINNVHKIIENINKRKISNY